MRNNMQKIIVSGEVFKQIERQLVGNIKQADCIHRHGDWCHNDKLIEKNEGFQPQCEWWNYATQRECKYFEPKPINLILPEDVFQLDKTKTENWETEYTGYECDFTGRLKEIPLNESLTLVCRDCEGNGKITKSTVQYGGLRFDCKSCSGEGSITLIVREKIEFEYFGAGVFTGLGENMPEIITETFIPKHERKAGKYVLLRVELVKV
jgi:hypothetical protein